jgi:hypothetical protein
LKLFEKEDRPGIVFMGEIVQRGKLRFCKIFIQGNPRPVARIHITDKMLYGKEENLFDEAFQEWVWRGGFYKTVKDPTLLSVLATYQKEKLEGVVYYRKTFRFLPARDGSRELRFVLTTDKSNLGEREKRMLQVGEEQVLREEKEARDKEIEEARKKDKREKNLRAKNRKRLLSIVKQAIKNQYVAPEDAKFLDKLGLLQETTTFRSSYYLGEATTFRYDFRESGKEMCGFLGFGEKGELITIDERLPRDRDVYLREKKVSA